MWLKRTPEWLFKSVTVTNWSHLVFKGMPPSNWLNGSLLRVGHQIVESRMSEVPPRIPTERWLWSPQKMHHHRLCLQPILAQENGPAQDHCLATTRRLAWVPIQSVHQSTQVVGLARTQPTRQRTHQHFRSRFHQLLSPTQAIQLPGPAPTTGPVLQHRFRHLHQTRSTQHPTLWEMTNKLDDEDSITEFTSTGPKNYGYKIQQGKVCCKVRGFSFNVWGSRQLNDDVMRQTSSTKSHNLSINAVTSLSLTPTSTESQPPNSSK